MGEKTDLGTAAASFRKATAAEEAELDGTEEKPQKKSAADLLNDHAAAMRDDGPGGDPNADLDDDGNPTEDDEEPELPPQRPASAGYPEWADLSEVVGGFHPPRNVQVVFVRFPSAWTHAPDKGAVHADEKAAGRLFRWCVMWSLSPGDEITASDRCRGNPLRTADEFTKMSIRVVDGLKPDWSGRPSPGSVNLFWREIGAACRKELKGIYFKTHALSRQDRVDFFVNCVEVATSGG